MDLANLLANSFVVVVAVAVVDVAGGLVLLLVTDFDLLCAVPSYLLIL